MVRFARAHGSKSSNERQPEEASSWQDLKQQLLVIQNETQIGGQKEKQLTKKIIDYKTENAPEWAEFEEKSHHVSKKVKKEKKSDKSEKDISTDERCKHGRVRKNKLTKTVKDVQKMDRKLQKMLNNISVTDDQTGLSKKTVTDDPTGVKQQLLVIQNETQNGGQKEKQITKVIDCKTENAPEWAEFEEKSDHVSKKVKKEKKSDKSEKYISTDERCKHGRVRKNKLTKTVKAVQEMDRKLQMMLNNISVTDDQTGLSKKTVTDDPTGVSKSVADDPTGVSTSVADNRTVLPEIVIDDPTSLSKTVTDRPNPTHLSKRQRRKNKEAMITVSRLDLVSNADIDDGVDLADLSLPLTKKQMKNAAILDLVSNADIVDGADLARSSPITKRQLKRKKQLKKKRANKIDLAPPDTVDTANASVKRKSDEIVSEGTPTVILSKRQKRNQKLAKEGVDFSQRAKAHKRRKPNQGTKVLINGQEVEIVLFDGFPILKQDADNLTELRKQMVANGIPEAEIKRAMKLERRKAEKALAREKKKVCFHCRQSGHNLSECPELGDGSNQDVPGSGICFKCGSTEHTHFECRVNRGQEFRFAKCFICNEQGHISRQCPDNPRGLYPKGGGCKVCGDVTHLKKDCPDLINKKEEQNITLEMANGDNLELLDEDIKKDIKKEEVDPFARTALNKIIKF